MTRRRKRQLRRRPSPPHKEPGLGLGLEAGLGLGPVEKLRQDRRIEQEVMKSVPSQMTTLDVSQAIRDRCRAPKAL